MPSITGVLTASGDSAALITASASQSIQVWSLSIMGKDSDITVVVKTGSTGQYTVLCPATGTGGISHPSGHEPVFTGAAGDDLVINLSALGDIAYNINYAIKGPV